MKSEGFFPEADVFISVKKIENLDKRALLLHVASYNKNKYGNACSYFCSSLFT